MADTRELEARLRSLARAEHSDLSTAEEAAEEAADELAAMRHEVEILRSALERHQSVFFGRRPDGTHMSNDEYRVAHADAFLHGVTILNPPLPAAPKE